VIRLLALALVASFLTLIPIVARGDCTRVDHVELVQGVAQVNTTYTCIGSDGENAENIAQVQPPRDSDLDALCVQEALSYGTDPFRFCDLPPDEPLPPVVTPGIVAAAFRQLPLPEAKLVIQPPNGRTLVNFETNFYTEQGEFTRTVTLLGRQVELRIWPASFGWRFGDGETDQTTSPGAAYPDLEVTHEYLKKGRVSPSVDTTYAAQFRVGGGPWRDVAGTVTIPGSPQGLRVVEARPVLVGG
jgi:hypothetical protein